MDSLLFKLKTALNSNEAYSILDGIGDTWLSGGCFLLAKVLFKMIPKSKLIILMGNGKTQKEIQPQHALVQVGNYFIDGDGVSTKDALIKRWETLEGILNIKIEPFEPSKHKADFIDLEKTNRFKIAEHKLQDYLSRRSSSA